MRRACQCQMPVCIKYPRRKDGKRYDAFNCIIKCSQLQPIQSKLGFHRINTINLSDQVLCVVLCELVNGFRMYGVCILLKIEFFMRYQTHQHNKSFSSLVII